MITPEDVVTFLDIRHIDHVKFFANLDWDEIDNIKMPWQMYVVAMLAGGGAADAPYGTKTEDLFFCLDALELIRNHTGYPLVKQACNTSLDGVRRWLSRKEDAALEQWRTACAEACPS